jgi:pentose-5-phosphate-3-epimerase
MINLKNVIHRGVPVQPETPSTTTPFTSDEIKLLLMMVRQSTFKGDTIESVYNLVNKLQTMYNEVSERTP